MSAQLLDPAGWPRLAMLQAAFVASLEVVVTISQDGWN